MAYRRQRLKTKLNVEGNYFGRTKRNLYAKNAVVERITHRFVIIIEGKRDHGLCLAKQVNFY